MSRYLDMVDDPSHVKKLTPESLEPFATKALTRRKGESRWAFLRRVDDEWWADVQARDGQMGDEGIDWNPEDHMEATR